MRDGLYQPQKGASGTKNTEGGKHSTAINLKSGVTATALQDLAAVRMVFNPARRQPRPTKEVGKHPTSNIEHPMKRDQDSSRRRLLNIEH
jgi:hypothetical protein